MSSQEMITSTIPITELINSDGTSTILLEEDEAPGNNFICTLNKFRPMLESTESEDESSLPMEAEMIMFIDHLRLYPIVIRSKAKGKK